MRGLSKLVAIPSNPEKDLKGFVYPQFAEDIVK
jgi:hypothetical protein